MRDECANIGKTDIQMGTYKIKAHTVEAVLSEIRPLFARHGVDMWPNLHERTYTGNRCDVLIDFTFYRTDKPEETQVIRWAGAGTDNADKGFAKAGTNALKEMLKKRFLVTDRDDAKEQEEAVPHVEGGDSERASSAVLQWAKTFKVALEAASTKKAVRGLELDNKAQLADPALPDVTRAFFIELIETKKKELPDG